uniref:Uncharacterized protein n=1 Tax=Rhizophora mucronata TaxID=61149 RepID=A0A2P2QEW2_RHIMU
MSPWIMSLNKYVSSSGPASTKTGKSPLI